MWFSLVKGLLVRNSNSLLLTNTFNWTIANLNFTQSKYCIAIQTLKTLLTNVCIAGHWLVWNAQKSIHFLAIIGVFEWLYSIVQK